MIILQRLPSPNLQKFSTLWDPQLMIALIILWSERSICGTPNLSGMISNFDCYPQIIRCHPSESKIHHWYHWCPFILRLSQYNGAFSSHVWLLEKSLRSIPTNLHVLVKNHWKSSIFYNFSWSNHQFIQVCWLKTSSSVLGWAHLWHAMRNHFFTAAGSPKSSAAITLTGSDGFSARKCGGKCGGNLLGNDELLSSKYGIHNDKEIGKGYWYSAEHLCGTI